jgi:uncharacterized protein (TIGR01244 family)
VSAAKLVLVLVALASTALASCATAERKEAAVATDAATTSVALHAPKPGLYTAAQPAPSNWSAIAARGVRTVINLRPDAELEGRDVAAEVRAAGMAYHAIPVAGLDGITVDNAKRLSAMLARVDGPVLVHCSSANRAGGLLAVAAAQEGMDAEAALALGHAAGMKSAEVRVREVLGMPADESKAPR